MKQYYCKSKNCTKEISYWSLKYGSGYCKSCSQLGDRNHNYKAIKYYKKCKNCGKKLNNKNIDSVKQDVGFLESLEVYSDR